MSKVVLIGDGAVGSTFAYTLLVKGLVNELIIIDANREKASGDVLDLNHGLMLAKPMRIRVGDYADCAGADIIVIAAGAAQRPGETRLDLMSRNVAIFDAIIKQVTTYNQTGILLIATNPVDILTQVALKLSGWPKNRVIGSGTLLDSSRFRYLVAERLRVDPRSVHGMVVGEHGDSEVLLWSSLVVAGITPEAMPEGNRWHLSATDKEAISADTKGAAYQIIAKKGATFYAIALALSRICEAILKDQRSVLPVSTYLDGYHGISGVCLGVPAVVGRSGVEEVVQVPLSQAEVEQISQSAAKLAEFLGSIGF
ncbi:MAG: L-lactate dehydrogenase [Mycobacterium leprae]